jgi:Putative adhesin
VVTKSGNIAVQVGVENEARVTLTGSGATGDVLFENAVVHFDAKSNELLVHTQPRDQFDSLSGLKNLFRLGGLSGLGDLDVMLTLPEGSSIAVVTGSGDTMTRGALANIDVTTGSGDVKVGDTVNSLDVKTGSGDVVAGHVIETFESRCASGDVRCEGAATNTTIHTASGDVAVTAVRGGEISVRAVSGDVRIDVKPGLLIDVEGTTVSGDLGSSIPLDASGDDEDESADDETVSLRVTTVSGDVRISRAS